MRKRGHSEEDCSKRPQKRKSTVNMLGWWSWSNTEDASTSQGGEKFLRCVSGNTLGSDEEFIRKLKEGIPGLKEEFNVENCDFILVFCPVVSRAGTDIELALKKLQDLSETKPAVLVVLHHTFNTESIVPDSSRSVNRENTLSVDCLFHEDRGLLQCYRNQEALEKVTQWIKPPEILRWLQPLNNPFSYIRNMMTNIPSRSTAPDLKQQKENSEQRLGNVAAAATMKAAQLEDVNKELTIKLQKKDTLLQDLHKTLSLMLYNTNPKHLEDEQHANLIKHLEDEQHANLIKHLEDEQHANLIKHLEDEQHANLIKHLEDEQHANLIKHLEDEQHANLIKHLEDEQHANLIKHLEDEQHANLIKHLEDEQHANLIKHLEDEQHANLIKHLEDEQHANLIKHLEDCHLIDPIKKHLREIEQELNETSEEVKITDEKTPTNNETLSIPPPPNTSKDPLKISTTETEEGFISYEKLDDKESENTEKNNLTDQNAQNTPNSLTEPSEM
ncbi:uncharacterized protein LOC103027786 [Astyanax mexicanus]|uniref:uncharacterized protein LOC103027786 n=1 Tax=Astyanax mexicanus TaxID=7994 RepID=UPI0020CAE293|nr:uncharacterized protein LOC103027786 [Astyanax mexicanus]